MCDRDPDDRIGSNEKSSLAAYCQITCLLRWLKWASMDDSTADRAAVVLSCLFRRRRRKETQKLLKAEAKRRQLGGPTWGAGNSQQRTVQGSDSDSDWDLIKVAKTLGGGGPPLVVPNPHIARSRERLATAPSTRLSAF